MSTLNDKRLRIGGILSEDPENGLLGMIISAARFDTLVYDIDTGVMTFDIPTGVISGVNLLHLLSPLTIDGVLTVANALETDLSATAGYLRVMAYDNAGVKQRFKYGAAGTGPGGVGKAVYI